MPVHTLDPVLVRGHRLPIVPLELDRGSRLLNARYGAAAVSDGDYIYVIGGANSQRVCLDDIERFNVRTKLSEHYGRLHTARRLHGAVLADGKIYVLGGYRDLLPQAPAADAFTDSVEIIDLATGKINEGPPMPVAKAQFAAAFVDGKIYTIGGILKRGVSLIAIVSTNTAEVYDLATAKWSKGIPMPTPRQSPAVVVTGFIVVPGGQSGVRQVTDVEVFNPREKIWRILPKLDQPVSMHSVVFLDHYLFLFDRNRVTAYELNTKEAATYPLDYRAARFTAAVVNQGKIYVLGGSLATSDPTEDYSDFNVDGPPPNVRDIPRGALAGKGDPFDDAEAIDTIQVFELRPGDSGAGQH